jgi:hypothetical protein
MMMPNPEGNELSAYIEQVIAATRAGTMSWMEVNPTTFVWDTREPRPARLSLQKVARTVPIQSGRPGYGTRIDTTYLLQALEMNFNNPAASKVRLSMNGAEKPEMNDSLKTLYMLVEAAKIKDSVDFLRSIIPPIPKT